MSLMSISIAVLLSFLFAFAWSANARKDSGDYWKGVMKDEPMPTALKALILPSNNASPSKSSFLKKPDCGEHHATDSQVDDAKKLATVREDFEPRPSITAYVKQDSSRENFEPRASLTAYVNEMGTTTITSTSAMSKQDEEEEAEKPALLNSFEPRPNVSSYRDGDTSVVVMVEEKQPKMEKEEDDRVSNSSFEPRPNVSAYGD